jgi:hypothetical protein
MTIMVSLYRLTECEEAHGAWSETLSRRGRLQNDHQHLHRLSSQVASLEQSMAELQEQANRLSSLSPATLIHLDRVDARLRALKEDLERQQRRKLWMSHRGGHEDQHSDQHEDEDDENAPYNAVLPSGWERGLTREKIPYYLNHADETTQWDHPIYSELMCSLLDMNTVKFSAYRSV